MVTGLPTLEKSLLQYVIEYLEEEKSRRTGIELARISEYGVGHLVAMAVDAYKGGAR